MAQKSLYILTVRAILVILVAVVVAGAVGGAVTSWYITKNILKKNTGGRVIERVETVGATNVFASVVQTMKGGVVGILNDKGQILTNGTVLTADGIVVAPMQVGLVSPKLLFTDGTVHSSSVLRGYPEKGIMFLRVAGSFPAPQLAQDSQLSAGTIGVFMRLVEGAVKVGAMNDMIEYFSVLGTSTNKIDLDKYAKVVSQANESYYGSPLFDEHQVLLGILFDKQENYILPASEINVMLQDLLRRPVGESVSVMDGLLGEWVVDENAAGKVENVFAVTSVNSSSIFAKSGVAKNDKIIAANDKTFPQTSLWASLLEGARAGKSVSLTVRRGDQEVKLTVNPVVMNAKKDN